MDKLVEHDKRLASMVAEAVMHAVDTEKVSAGRSQEHGKSDNNKFSSISKVSLSEYDRKTEQNEDFEDTKEDALPEEALAYLLGL